MRKMGWMLLAVLALSAVPTPAQPPADSVDTLARDVSRIESLRAVKDLQRLYAQSAQSGRWAEMAALFGARGRMIWGERTIEGRSAIAAFLARHGTGPGALDAELIDDPLVSLSADGESAQGRWRGLALRGDGAGKAWIEGGLYENTYVREAGRWTIATLHYHPQYEGDYVTGWRNAGGADLPIVPFHFTPDSAGIPIPPAPGLAPRSGTSLAALAGRVAALNDEDDVRNLQHAYGYYVDRRMWDDVADLFSADGVIDIAGAGRFKGPAGIRKALERMGPAGLAPGDLNDRPQFDTIVRIAPGGGQAFARGTELAMLSHAGRGGWEISVFRTRFVQQAGIWKISEMRLQPLVKADYATGWGRGAARPRLPDLPSARPVAIPGRTLDDTHRRYQRALATDAATNLSAAYGYYLDDFQWPQMSGIFAAQGNKQSPFAGYYFGRDRIAAAATAMWGKTADPATALRGNIAFHWRIQPVILVSHDGRSATLRTRLLQPATSKVAGASGFAAGMYPNDQLVLEDGIWRFWSLTIDEHYFSSPDWKGGWAAATAPPPGGPARASPLMTRYPPDLPITALGRREEGFRGGTGTVIDWPGILPMWFHYRNPVSGRQPERYWPDCVPCEKRPETGMTRHGYQLPPPGPQADGLPLPGRE